MRLFFNRSHARWPHEPQSLRANDFRLRAGPSRGKTLLAGQSSRPRGQRARRACRRGGIGGRIVALFGGTQPGGRALSQCGGTRKSETHELAQSRRALVADVGALTSEADPVRGRGRSFALLSAPNRAPPAVPNMISQYFYLKVNCLFDEKKNGTSFST